MDDEPSLETLIREKVERHFHVGVPIRPVPPETRYYISKFVDPQFQIMSNAQHSLIEQHLRQRESESRSPSPLTTGGSFYHRRRGLPALEPPFDDDRKLMLLYLMRKEQDSLAQQIRDVEFKIEMKKRQIQLQEHQEAPTASAFCPSSYTHRRTLRLKPLSDRKVSDLTIDSFPEEIDSRPSISDTLRLHRLQTNRSDAAVESGRGRAGPNHIPNVRHTSSGEDKQQRPRSDIGVAPHQRQVLKTNAPNFCVPVALPTDRKVLSKYQVLLRSSLEFCVASVDDTTTSQQGRRQCLRVGQVGIRCIHCSHLPPAFRSKGAANYPRSIGSLYQAAQNVATAHFLSPTQSCRQFPAALKKEMMEAKNQSATSLVGPPYWARECRKLGMAEEDGSVWLTKDSAAAADAETVSA